MAAEVSSIFQVMNRTARNNSDGNSRDVITRDLLGESFKNDTQELDLDMEVPSGYEKRLDLKSGRVYIQRCNSPSFDHKQQSNQTVPKFQDLNFPPSPTKPLLNLLDDNNLDLKLVSQTTSSSLSPCNYQSICTLDKVKSALERAEKVIIKKRSSTSPSHSSSSSFTKVIQDEDDEASSLPIAAGCPSCLLYVLVSRSNPKCPSCNSVVPMPAMKKPRIDLNMSI